MKLAIVRIRKGEPNPTARTTLECMKLTRINNCIIIPDTKIYLGMLQAIKDYVTWGPVSEDGMMAILPRAKPVGMTLEEYLKKNKKSLKDISSALLTDKSLKELGLSQTIGLHPPRGGHKSVKRAYPKGALGNRKDAINKLLVRMR
ncbi:MAG: uL30 family ribosomal protein [archaeon]